MLQQLFNDASIKPSIVQNRFYRESDYDKSLRTWAKEQGITYQSFWSLSANPHILHSKIVQTIAHKYHKSVEQIFYRYLIHEGIVPLNGTTSLKHMAEDLSIFELTLSFEEISLISTLLV